jgi:hypothetical protein
MNIKIRYCIDPKIFMKHSTKTGKQISFQYGIEKSLFYKLTSYKKTRQKKYLQQIPEEFLEPVIWNVKTEKITRFKDAKKKEEKELIKLFKEDNE